MTGEVLADAVCLLAMFFVGRVYQYATDRRYARQKAAHLERLNRQIDRGTLARFTEPTKETHVRPR